jgi:hypothetical protein
MKSSFAIVVGAAIIAAAIALSQRYTTVTVNSPRGTHLIKVDRWSDREMLCRYGARGRLELECIGPEQAREEERAAAAAAAQSEPAKRDAIEQLKRGMERRKQQAPSQ